MLSRKDDLKSAEKEQNMMVQLKEDDSEQTERSDEEINADRQGLNSWPRIV